MAAIIAEHNYKMFPLVVVWIPQVTWMLLVVVHRDHYLTVSRRKHSCIHVQEQFKNCVDGDILLGQRLRLYFINNANQTDCDVVVAVATSYRVAVHRSPQVAVRVISLVTQKQSYKNACPCRRCEGAGNEHLTF